MGQSKPLNHCRVLTPNKEMIILRIILLISLISLSLASIGRDERRFGNCDTSTCRYDQGRARQCCDSGRNTRCCFYIGGEGGGGWNNGGGYNNNKPGSCPPYNGRRRRSPEEAPWNNGGSGYNPGHGHGGHGGGRCIRDSECPGAMKCCYRRSGYQCTRPQYYG